MQYQFQSIQQHVHRDPSGHIKRVTEGVAIRTGPGVKAVEIQQNNDIRRAVRPLTTPELANIQGKQFMPKLFADCHGDCNAKTPKKTRKAAKKVKKTKKKKRGTK
jgi:hypothetical protein